jgi:hypothetical protein
MFNLTNWDTLGELFLDLLVVLVLCIFLFIWAARVRARDVRARGEEPVKAAPVRHRPPQTPAPPAAPAPPATESPLEGAARNDSRP